MGTSDVNIYKNVSNNKNCQKLFLFTQTNFISVANPGLTIRGVANPLFWGKIDFMCTHKNPGWKNLSVLKTVSEVSEIVSSGTFNKQWSEAWPYANLNVYIKSFNIC